MHGGSRADAAQKQALETIFKACWAGMGEVLKVKSAPISFSKEAVGSGPEPGYRHRVTWGDYYALTAEPLMTVTGQPRYISGPMGGKIYVGKSSENRYSDLDLPRGKWDRPNMSNTYYEFSLTPSHRQWVP